MEEEKDFVSNKDEDYTDEFIP
jgi:hypothetical protein